MTFAFTDAAVVAMATAVISLVGTMFSGVMAYLLARLNQQTESASVKVEAVKRRLDETTSATSHKLDGLAKVAKDTHTLVNSNMAAQLRLNAAVTRRLAGVTGRPEDAKAADLAEALYGEHEAKQAKVDRSNEGGG
jgi:hypothetical protein